MRKFDAELFLTNLTTEDLKGICSNLNIKKTGIKAELVKRISMRIEGTSYKLMLNLNDWNFTDFAKYYGEDIVNWHKMSRDELILKGLEILQRNDPQVIKQEKDVTIGELQLLLQNFFKKYDDQTFQQYIPEENINIKLNGMVYEIEAKIYKLKKEYGINLILDPKIFSPSIRKSLTEQTKIKDYYRNADYQIPALVFLTEKIIKDKRPKYLIEITDEYFEQEHIKNLLKYPDIKIHLTGGTRCKTNFQLAINHLTHLGLLTSADDTPIFRHQNYLPSFFGIAITAYLRNKHEQIVHNYNIENTQFLYIPTKYKISFAIDPLLLEIIEKSIIDDEMITDFIDSEFTYLSKANRDAAIHLLVSYCQFIKNGMTIELDENSIPIRIHKIKDFDKKTSKFVEAIKEDKEYNKVYKEILNYYGLDLTQESLFDEIA